MPLDVFFDVLVLLDMIIVFSQYLSDTTHLRLKKNYTS
jgi:hypothetical protein